MKRIKYTYQLFNITLSIVLLLLCLNVNAQTVLISEDINIRTDEAYQIIGQTDEHIFFFHDKASNIEIIVYDRDLRYVRTNIIELEKRRVVPFGIALTDQDINFIYYHRDKGQIVMSCRRYNDQLELIEKDTIFVTERADLSPNFMMAESEDESKVLIYSMEKNSIIHAHCYDLKTNSNAWQQDISTSGKLREDFSDALISDSGVGYFISDRSPTSFKKQRLNLEVIRYSQGMNEAIKFDIEVSELKSNEIEYSYDNRNGFIIASGLYSEKTSDRLNGLFVLKINTLNPDKRAYKKYPFDAKLEADIIAESRDKHEGVLDLKPVDIVIREDGGILLLSEIQKKHQRYGGIAGPTSRNSGTRNWTDYYHEDIVMHAFHPDGAQHWNLVLHKKQYSQDDAGSYSSFFLFKNRSAIRLFFNDEISNSNTVSEYIIAGNGRSQRKSVMSTEYQKLKLRFADALQLDGRSFIVPSDNGNKINLVKIAYE